MKKILVVHFAFFIMCSAFKVNAQHEQGKMHFDIYHGLPPHTGIVFRTLVDIQYGQSAKISTIGNLGARFQYFLRPTFSLGFDANYTLRTAEITYEDISMGERYTDRLEHSVTRAMIRTSWEFVEIDGFQANWANSMGIRYANWNQTSTDPFYEFFSETAGAIPFSIRSAIGMRYMFTKNIGFNLELGIGGGALLNGGITIALDQTNEPKD